MIMITSFFFCIVMFRYKHIFMRERKLSSWFHWEQVSLASKHYRLEATYYKVHFQMYNDLPLWASRSFEGSIESSIFLSSAYCTTEKKTVKKVMGSSVVEFVIPCKHKFDMFLSLSFPVFQNFKQLYRSWLDLRRTSRNIKWASLLH
jgi:hypothetical protein